MNLFMIASILFAGVTVHTANLENIGNTCPVVTNVSYTSDLPTDYTTTNAVCNLITNNVADWAMQGQEKPVTDLSSRTTFPQSTNIAEHVARAMKPVKLGAYVWEVGTEGEDWTGATNRLAKVYPSWGGGCTGVKAGQYHGRNLDWYYDKGATIVVRSSAREGKFGCIGIAGGVKTLTDDFLMSEKWDDSYYSLPFTWTDGMNEKGVVIQSNVIPKDTTKSSAWRTKRDGCIVCFAMIRYVLDRCSTAYEAAVMLRDKTFMPSEFNYDDHYLVSDLTSSYIVEDGIIYSAADIPTDLLTNFRCGTASYDSSTKKVDWDTVEQYGQGLERYDWVRTNGLDNTVLDGIVNTMKGLWYTKSYLTTTTPFWYTEYCGPESETGFPDLTVHNAKYDQSVFASAVAQEIAEYTAEHDTTSVQYRGGKTWQTVHTAIYDQQNLSVRLFTQEDAESVRVFNLKKDAPLDGYATKVWVTNQNYVTESVTNGILAAAKDYTNLYTNQAPDYANVSNKAMSVDSKQDIIEDYTSTNAVKQIVTANAGGFTDWSVGGYSEGTDPVPFAVTNDTTAWRDDQWKMHFAGTYFGQPYSAWIATDNTDPDSLSVSDITYGVESTRTWSPVLNALGLAYWNDTTNIVAVKRDLTNNVCVTDSFVYSAWSKENLPSDVAWDDQPFVAFDGLWTWHYVDVVHSSEGYSQGGMGENDNETFQTFGYGEGFTSTRTAIKVAASNDVFTTYIFVTNAIANATPDLSSRTTFAQATNIVASAAVTNAGAVAYADANFVTPSTLSTYAPLTKDHFTYYTALSIGPRKDGTDFSKVGAKSLAQGDNCAARGDYSFAAGYQSVADGKYSHAEGAQTTVTGMYTFAWCGDVNGYSPKGTGTFNIKPVGGISGFYIGNDNLATHMTNVVNSVADASVTAAVDNAMKDLLGDNWKTTYGGGLAGLIAAIVAALTWMKNKRLDITTVCAEWSSLTTYAKGANVVYNGKFYTSKADSNTNHAPTDTTWWDVSTLFSSTNTSLTSTIKGTKVDSATAADTATSATSATNATNATYATNDAGGNNIANTYATKSEAGTKINYNSTTQRYYITVS